MKPNTLQKHQGKEIKPFSCYGCKKCSTGCPAAPEMDLLPHQIVELVQLEAWEELLNCKTLWACASCKTCADRCPNEVDPARIIDFLRVAAIKQTLKSDDKDKQRVALFHKIFLDGVRRSGKLSEVMLVSLYKTFSHDFFSDLGLGLEMFLKGKLPILPESTKDMRAVRRLLRELDAREDEK